MSWCIMLTLAALCASTVLPASGSAQQSGNPPAERSNSFQLIPNVSIGRGVNIAGGGVDSNGGAVQFRVPTTAVLMTVFQVSSQSLDPCFRRSPVDGDGCYRAWGASVGMIYNGFQQVFKVRPYGGVGTGWFRYGGDFLALELRLGFQASSLPIPAQLELQVQEIVDSRIRRMFSASVGVPISF